MARRSYPALIVRALPLIGLPLVALLGLATTGCAEREPVVPSRDLALRHVVLYQNGVGYFERVGSLRGDRLRLQFRTNELEDVLKTLVVVENGAASPNTKPSTVTVLLPQATSKDADPNNEEPTWLDVVLSPRPAKELSIAYAVPTAAWKSAYRVILPEENERAKGVLLQAWALIDNVSEEDWTSIKLTLATGAPLTFNTDFRAVRTARRPRVGGFQDEMGATGPVEAERLAAADQDADGIPDAEDACPNAPGAADMERYKNGCPRAMRVTLSEQSIQILQTVTFENNADAIKPISLPILDEIVNVLKSHPEIRKLTIEGHASTNEKDAWGLASRRASAVRNYLVQRGVMNELTVISYGDSRPIAENSKEDGRSRNRRVSFQIADTRPASNEPATTPPSAISAAGLAKTGQSSAVLRDVAGMIRYDITHPVSIPRMSSTLVTIINEYMPGEEIFLYRPDANMPGSDRYPMRAARLENKSGFGLQAGPVAIYGGGTFVGEGLLGKLSPGDTALVPYGIDSSTTVKVEPQETVKPERIVGIARGVMTVEDSRIVTTRYTIATGAQAPQRIFVRHSRGPGFSVGALPPGTETTDEAYLVPLPIAPKKTSVLTIEERRARREDLSILSTDGPKLSDYLKGGGLTADEEKRVRDVVALRTQVGRLVLEIQAIQTQLGDNAQRSQELRDNLRAIERTPRASPVQQRLLDRLAEAAKQSEDLSAKLASKNTDLAEARATLTEAIRDLRVEPRTDPKAEAKP